MKNGQTRQLILPSLIARLIRRRGYCPIQLHPRLSFHGSDALRAITGSLVLASHFLRERFRSPSRTSV